VLVDHNGPDLRTNLHCEADLGEGCVPVGRQLGLLRVKPSLPSCKVEVDLVAPEFGIVVKGSLDENKNNRFFFQLQEIKMKHIPVRWPW